MYLNEDLSDEQILITPRYTRVAPSTVAAAFHGKPEKRRINPPQLLFRISTLPDDRVFHGVWWFSHDIFQWLMQESGGDRKAFVKLARIHLAVKLGWSSGMRHIYVIQLTQPVYAWVGPARAQQETTAHLKHVKWPGGAEQIYLPNLASKEYRLASDHARLIETYAVLVDYDPREDPEPLET